MMRELPREIRRIGSKMAETMIEKMTLMTTTMLMTVPRFVPKRWTCNVAILRAFVSIGVFGTPGSCRLWQSWASTFRYTKGSADGGFECGDFDVGEFFQAAGVALGL